MGYYFKRPSGTDPSLNEKLNIQFSYEHLGMKDIESDNLELMFSLGNGADEYNPNHNDIGAKIFPGRVNLPGSIIFDDSIVIEPFKGTFTPIPISTTDRTRVDTSQFRLHKAIMAGSTPLSTFYLNVLYADIKLQDSNNPVPMITIRGVIYKKNLDWYPGIMHDIPHANYFNEIGIYIGDRCKVIKYDDQTIPVTYPTEDSVDAYPIARISFRNISIDEIPPEGAAFELFFDASSIIAEGVQSSNTTGGGTIAWFPDETSRDDYYNINPDNLKSGISVGVGTPIVVYTYDGTSWITGALAFQGPAGAKALLQNDGTYIKWKSDGDAVWQNLIAISALIGPNGKNPIIDVNNGYIVWKLTGDTSWQNLIAISALKGAPGDKGDPGKSAYEIWLELGNTGTEQDFIDSLKGEDGEDGQDSNGGGTGSGEPLTADSLLSTTENSKSIKRQKNSTTDKVNFTAIIDPSSGLEVNDSGIGFKPSHQAMTVAQGQKLDALPTITQINDAVNDLGAAITAEITERQHEDSVEAGLREDGDNALQTQIDDVTDLLSDNDTVNKANSAFQSIPGATTGNFAAIDQNGKPVDSGKKASDFATAAEGTLAQNALPASDVIDPTTADAQTDVGKAADATKTKEIVEDIQEQIDNVKELVPTQASAGNQLADKDFVNSTVQNFAANYVTPTADGNSLYTDLASVNAGPWFHAGESYTPTKNDYATYANTTEGTWRVGYDGTQFNKQYHVNEIPLTATQVAALNSNITAAIVAKFGNKGITDEDLADTILTIGTETTDKITTQTATKTSLFGILANAINGLISKLTAGSKAITSTMIADKSIGDDQLTDTVMGVTVETTTKLVTTTDTHTNLFRKIANAINGLITSLGLKYTFPTNGIPKGDLTALVQGSLDKADTSVQPNDINDIRALVKGDLGDIDISTSTTAFASTAAGIYKINWTGFRTATNIWPTVSKNKLPTTCSTIIIINDDTNGNGTRKQLATFIGGFCYTMKVKPATLFPTQNENKWRKNGCSIEDQNGRIYINKGNTDVNQNGKIVLHVNGMMRVIHGFDLAVYPIGEVIGCNIRNALSYIRSDGADIKLFAKKFDFRAQNQIEFNTDHFDIPSGRVNLGTLGGGGLEYLNIRAEKVRFRASDVSFGQRAFQSGGQDIKTVLRMWYKDNSNSLDSGITFKANDTRFMVIPRPNMPNHILRADKHTHRPQVHFLEKPLLHLTMFDNKPMEFTTMWKTSIMQHASKTITDFATIQNWFGGVRAGITDFYSIIRLLNHICDQKSILLIDARPSGRQNPDLLYPVPYTGRPIGVRKISNTPQTFVFILEGRPCITLQLNSTKNGLIVNTYDRTTINIFGITLILVRRGSIVQYSFKGTLTSSLSAGATVFSIPVGYQYDTIIQGMPIAADSKGSSLQFDTNNVITAQTAFSSGEPIYGGGTWVASQIT